MTVPKPVELPDKNFWLSPAGLLRRWAAAIYDGLLLFALLLVAGFAVLTLVNPSVPGAGRSSGDLYLSPQ